MPTFIIRSQGFFYTDEYFAPGDVFKPVGKKKYPTKAAAEEARAALVRKWVRSEPLGNYVFDDKAATAAVLKYLQAEWPSDFDDKKWLWDVEIPKKATDKQVDELVKRMGVTFAEVFKVEEGAAEDADDDGDEDEDEEGEGEEGGVGDLYYGPKP